MEVEPHPDHLIDHLRYGISGSSIARALRGRAHQADGRAGVEVSSARGDEDEDRRTARCAGDPVVQPDLPDADRRRIVVIDLDDAVSCRAVEPADSAGELVRQDGLPVCVGNAQLVAAGVNGIPEL